MFKEIKPQDITVSKNTLHEAIAIDTSSFVSGATARYYNNSTLYHTSSSNHGYGGMVVTTYDAGYDTSSSYALFDIAFGIDSASNTTITFTAESLADLWPNKFYQQYRLFQTYLLGSTDTPFKLPTSGNTITHAHFISIKRNIFRDALKHKSVEITQLSRSMADFTATSYGTISDASSDQLYKCHMGHYAALVSNSNEVGLVFYEAGVAVLSSSVFAIDDTYLSGAYDYGAAYNEHFPIDSIISGGTLDYINSGALMHFEDISFQNSVNIYSRVFNLFLRPREFTYSANPTFVNSDGQIITTMSGSDALQTKYSETYITAAGLYDANGDLLAVAKLSRPALKTWDNAFSIRVRLDY